MSPYILICRDKPGALETRMSVRPDHLAFLEKSDVKVWLAGPMLSEEEKPVGSLLIIEVENLKAAQAFAEDDPYAKAGLFDAVEIKPYRFVLGDLINK